MANKAARLAELYAKIPPMLDCKGKCDASCGPVVQVGLMTTYEYSRLRDVPRIEHDNPVDCDLLTPEGRCSAYELRPAICRMWGTVDTPKLRCPFGCTPAWWLSDAESDDILKQIVALSGAGGEFAFGALTVQAMAVITEEAKRQRAAKAAQS